MEILVFGATGRVGLKIVHYALIAEHKVKAFVRRNPKNYPIRNQDLQLIEGDITDYEAIESAVEGKDVVISALGSRNFDKPITLMSDAAKNILKAMERHQVKRVLAIGGAGVLQAEPETLRKDAADFPPFLKNVSDDHFRVYELLAASNLDWTFVCPPNMPDGELTQEYLVKADYLPAGTQQISTADVADFIVYELAANQYLKHRVGITYK